MLTKKSAFSLVNRIDITWVDKILTSKLNLLLTDELRNFVNSRVGDNGAYATPNEFLRDLICRDMESQTTLMHIMGGLDDIKHGKLSDLSIMDIAKEA